MRHKTYQTTPTTSCTHNIEYYCGVACGYSFHYIAEIVYNFCSFCSKGFADGYEKEGHK